MNRILIPAVLIALAACSPAPEAETLAAVAATDAVCRPTPNGRDVTGCYVTLTASRDDRLVSVTTSAATVAQVHEMSTEGGIMKMGEMTDGLPLPAGQSVSLAPGGNHIMLTGVASPLAEGDAVALTLTFENAQTLGVNARVGQPATPEDHTGH